jgi:hypothetical protein
MRMTMLETLAYVVIVLAALVPVLFLAPVLALLLRRKPRL